MSPSKYLINRISLRRFAARLFGRRAGCFGSSGTTLLMLLGCVALFSSAHSAGQTESRTFTVHVYQSPEAGIFANAYLVETANHVVVVDSTLLESTSKQLRQQLEQLHKPLAAILITHGHPDHYNGVTNLRGNDSADVIATKAVDKVIRDHDAAKENQWRPVFKDEWPLKRTFPTRTFSDGQSLEVDGVKFTVHDLGPGESDADSYWLVEGKDNHKASRVAFIGDVVLDHVHAYTTDGHTSFWLANIYKLSKQLKNVPTLYPGHGNEGDVNLLAWQRGYLQAYRANVESLAHGNKSLSEADKVELKNRMEKYLSNTKLEFLIGLGADSVANELATERALK